MKTSGAFFLILICFLSCKEIEQTETNDTNSENQKKVVDSVTEIPAEKKTASNYWFDAEYEGEKLIKNGINNPEAFIEKSLRERTQLIPTKAVLGGKMNFGNIQILSSEWLISDFSDGHILGKAIYRYSLNSKDQLEFELLDYQIP